MIPLKYVTWRLLSVLPVMFVIVTLAFFLMRFTPGGPFDSNRALPPEIEENIKRKYRLDQPLWKQYTDYVGSILRGDLGPSYRYQNRSVNEIIASSFPVSFKLGLLSLSVALFFGILFGAVAALRKNRWQGYASMTIALLGVSIPNIVLGPMLIFIFGLWLGWLPVAEWGSISQMILPTITLSAIYIAYITRISRSAFLDIIHQDYVVFARTKGLSEARVFVSHVFKGGMLPVVSYLGPAFAYILTGSVVVEKIFQIPGLGQHFVLAALNRDYTLVLGTVIFYSFLLLAFNLIVDVLYAFLDPRVSYD